MGFAMQRSLGMATLVRHNWKGYNVSPHLYTVSHHTSLHHMVSDILCPKSSEDLTPKDFLDRSGAGIRVGSWVTPRWWSLMQLQLGNAYCFSEPSDWGLFASYDPGIIHFMMAEYAESNTICGSKRMQHDYSTTTHDTLLFDASQMRHYFGCAEERSQRWAVHSGYSKPECPTKSRSDAKCPWWLEQTPIVSTVVWQFTIWV